MSAVDGSNMDLITTSHKKIYNSFADLAATLDYRLPIQFGSVVSSQNNIQDSPYPSTNTLQWWNTIQFGIGNRFTQITTQVFLNYDGNNELWIRNRHDNSWSTWAKL